MSREGLCNVFDILTKVEKDVALFMHGGGEFTINN